MQNASVKRPPLKHRRNFLNDPRFVPYVLVAPFILFFAVVYLYPLIMTVIMSFQKIDGPNHREFIGLKNYMKLDREHYIACLEVYKDGTKRGMFKNDPFFLNWQLKILDGRVKHVLRRSPD